MINKSYKIAIAIIAIVFIVAIGEFVLTSEVAPLPSEISIEDYIGFSVAGTVLNSLLSVLLYIEYRMSEENAGVLFFYSISGKCYLYFIFIMYFLVVY